jgi:hypothetical protein
MDAGRGWLIQWLGNGQMQRVAFDSVGRREGGGIAMERSFWGKGEIVLGKGAHGIGNTALCSGGTGLRFEKTALRFGITAHGFGETALCFRGDGLASAFEGSGLALKAQFKVLRLNLSVSCSLIPIPAGCYNSSGIAGRFRCQEE